VAAGSLPVYARFDLENAPQEIIAVSKRPLSTFRALFTSPSSAEEQAKEIPWIDFLQAMVAAGFTPEKLRDSGWSFTSIGSGSACCDQRDHRFPRASRYIRDEAAVLVDEVVRTEADEGVWLGLGDVCGEASKD